MGEEEKEEKMEARKEKRRGTEYVGTTRRRLISTRACFTNDVMSKNDGDKSKARCACTDVLIRPRRVGKGLLNHARRITLSQDGTSPDGTGFVTGHTVESIEGRGGHCRKYKHNRQLIEATVFNLILRMQDVVFMLISTCI